LRICFPVFLARKWHCAIVRWSTLPFLVTRRRVVIDFFIYFFISFSLSASRVLALPVGSAWLFYAGR
jgi:hypothetical protein